MARTFRQRYEEAQGRIARLNRASMNAPTLEGPGSEQRLERIQKKFKTVTPRPRPIDRTRVGIGLWLFVWATCVGVTVGILLAAVGDGSVKDKLQRLASFPNCTISRVVGAAPADLDDPAYWPHNDRDNDGVACEPIPDWVER